MQRIFVGDIQGCAAELECLLERAEARYGRIWELWQVGDLVNRGPANLQVLERVRALRDAGRARVVLGNHDLGFLRAFARRGPPEPGDTWGDVLASADAGGWVDWLRRLPLVETGELGTQPFAMLHAAPHPDWDLAQLRAVAREIEERLAAPDRRDALAFLAEPAPPGSLPDCLARLTRCRSAAGDGRWWADPPGPDAAPEMQAWHSLWRQRRHDYGVVYGHWALQGLHVEPWLRGLDTACVHHGRDGIRGCLTAWLPDPASPTPFSVPDERFWQIPARQPYGRGAA